MGKGGKGKEGGQRKRWALLSLLPFSPALPILMMFFSALPYRPKSILLYIYPQYFLPP
jgi:hypothetical protein